jgi:hypothetical protein
MQRQGDSFAIDPQGTPANELVVIGGGAVASASSVVESLYQTVTWKPAGADHGSKKRSPLPDVPY